MNKQTSVYLDLVRFAAAVVVMLSHLGARSWTIGFGWQLVPFGGPAVDVFFVLSGYVIAYTFAEKERDITSYSVNRAARIYSVALPALTITAILGAVGGVVRPAFDWGDRSFVSYLISIFFTNQIWFASIEPGNNGPFWSIGYEVWYYIIFGCAVLFRGKLRLLLTVTSLLVAGPRIALMLPVWLTGVVAYRLSRRTSFLGATGGLILFAVSTLALAALALWQSHHVLTCGTDYCYLLPAFTRALLDWREYVADYGVGLLIACNFIGFFFSARFWATLTAIISQPVRWIAGATFTLYLLHYPVAQFLVTVSPWSLGSWPQRVFVYGTTLGSVFVIAQFTERRKDIWRTAIQHLTDRMRQALGLSTAEQLVIIQQPSLLHR